MEPTFIADILFFAALAGFIFYRLYSVLGRKDGTEENLTHRVKEAWEARAAEPQKKGKVEIFPPATKHRGKKAESLAKVFEAQIVEESEAPALLEIAKRDRSFTEERFLKGAGLAFEMIMKAYAEGDRETLQGLMEKSLYKEFEEGINDREKSGETLHHVLVSIDKAEIAEARLDKNFATIIVAFKTEQITCVKDKDGNVIEGSLTTPETIEDRWTFTRHLTSSDPNWTLVDTGE